MRSLNYNLPRCLYTYIDIDIFPCHRSGVRPVGATTAETKMGSKNTQLNSINNMAVREIIYTYIHIVYAAWNLLSMARNIVHFNAFKVRH